MSSRSEPISDVIARLITPARAGAPTEVESDDVAHCDKHGAYPQSMVDEQGVRRWFAGGCPACRKQDEVDRALSRAAISPRFAACTFESFVVESQEQAEAKRLCERFARPFAETLAAGRCLVMHGTPGTGKNHLAVAISREVMAQGYSALHTTAQEMITALRAGWGRNSGGDGEAARKAFCSVDLLCIDEVGRTYGGAGERVELFSVLDARYRAMKPTAIMSNGTPEEIEGFLGRALYDRLREAGGIRIAMTWPSVRRRAMALRKVSA